MEALSMGWWLALLAIGLAFGGGDDSTPQGGSTVVPFPKRAASLDAWLDAADLPPDWRLFFRLVAVRESGFKITAKNTTVGEAAAAKAAYERRREALAPCGHPEAWYTWGSGGWFGFLPVTAVSNLPNRCTDPLTAVFTPAHSIAAAVGFAHGLMGWSGYKALPTFLNLRVGWGNPGAMGDQAKLDAKFSGYVKDCERAGIPAALLGQVPSPLPMPAVVLSRLQAWAETQGNA